MTRRGPALGVTCALALMLPLVGCIGPGEVLSGQKTEQQKKADALLGDAGHDKLVDAAAIIPKNYSFAQQALLPPANLTVKATVGPDAIGGYEAERDEGSISYNTAMRMTDISSLLPPGQPAEIVLKLYWDGSEANSADVDIAVDVPGTKSSYSNDSQTLNWNYAVKTVVVDTVGVEGHKAEVGVQVAGALASQGFEYTLDIQVTYVKDVLTPYHAWALDVPASASGLIFESEKAGGDEHLTSEFIVIDPEDNLVQFVAFDDINIPTQSVFVPTTKPGTYVFYAYHMHGGFLRVKADVPLGSPAAHTLALVETKAVDSAAPSPGIAGHDYLNGSVGDGALPDDDVAPSVVQFVAPGAFPLRVTPYVTGDVTTMAKIVLRSPLGIVAERTVILRYEDEKGTLGYTSDHAEGIDHEYAWKNIAKGTWKAEIVNDAPNVELGHVVLSYLR